MSSHKLACLNTWSIAGGTIWKDGKTFKMWSLMEEVAHWTLALGLWSLALLPASVLQMHITICLFAPIALPSHAYCYGYPTLV